MSTLWRAPNWKAQHVAVVGAGLAGTATAEHLAALGIRCDLYDPAPASGASGNPQGMLYIAPQIDPTPASRFWVQAFDLACQVYQSSPHFHANGLLTLADSDEDEVRLARIFERLDRSHDDLQWLTAEQASDHLGMTVARPGLLWPKSGWMAVKAFVQRALTGVHHIPARVENIEETPECVRVNGQPYDAVVLCNAYAAKTFVPDYIQPRPVRGQISQIRGPQAALSVCGDGYLTPPDESGFACFGASFVPKDDQTDLRDQDDEFNQTLMIKLFGAPLTGDVGQSRASIRCASPDYLPMVGSLPKTEVWTAELSRLRVDAKYRPTEPASEFSRILLNIGHGSRGLTSTPLAARLLASELTGAEPPCDADLREHLSPARFLIRALKRNQI